jgi:glucose dehydrogenase/plastocyanin
MHGLQRGFLCLSMVVAIALLPAATSAQVAGGDWRQSAAANWPTVGGDWANTRYSTLSQIDTSNVSKLRGAWMARLRGSGFDSKYSQQGTPIVVDGVMYVPTGQQDVFAVNARTGSILWEYISDVDPRAVGMWNNRGVAVAEGKVFSIQKDAHIIALDQKTGKVLWKTEIAPELGPQRKYLSNALIYYNGMIYTGLSGGDSGVRGLITALDATTGLEVWHFYTVPGPGDFGHDTWEGDSWKTGGAAGWMHPAIDPDLGILYTPTGNSWPDNDGSVRGGDNLFTASIVALDARTGQYRWHFQEVHHDIWDYDNANSPVLLDLTIDGQPHKVLAHAGKTGWLYLLDRTNGQPLLGVEERPVPQDPRQKTAPTQPFPIGDAFVPQCPVNPVPGYATGCIFSPFWEDPVIMAPGTTGGSDYAPVAYSPQTGLVYVAASNMNSAFGVAHEAIDDTGNRVRLGGLGFFRPNGTVRSGVITAIDPRTNTIVWQKQTPFPNSIGSGVMATAGGLLFHGEPDGNFQAFDARTGDLLWQFQTGFGADGPPITFQLDGEQYVAIATGGNNLGLSARGDAVWAFKLSGDLLPLNSPPAPPKVQIITSAPVAVETVSIGRTWNADQKLANIRNEYAFGPENITVAVGATVTWTNDGDLAHSATSDSKVFDTGLLEPGGNATFTFDRAGTYGYFCSPHPWMIGQVVVK